MIIKVENEMGVVVAFAQMCEQHGWQLVSVQSEFPDAVIREIETGKEYRAEFEYSASSFVAHGHDPRGCDLIVCWVNDWEDCSMTIWQLSRGSMNWKVVELPATEKENLSLKLENRRLRNEIVMLREQTPAESVEGERGTYSEFVCAMKQQELTARQVSDRFRVPRRTAYNWINRYGQLIGEAE